MKRLNISDNETQMTFYLSNSKIPRDLFLYHFKTKTLKKLTNTLNPEINPDDLVEGQVIRFPSFDSLSIPGILYKPNGTQKGDKLPALLYIHGGPGGQTRLNYTDRIQYWVNQGYVVLAVNNRGSSGYGKTFYKADNLKHGDVDLKDCIASKKFLINTGYVDRDIIGIMGGSYGGYLVMAALTFTPNEFAVGINYFGVTNWLRTLRSIPTWWEASRNALYSELGNPETDSLALYNKSPLFFAHQITKPFIVFQGANDPRVLQVESDEIVAAARKNNIPVKYIVFPDEGHGFSKKINSIKAVSPVVILASKIEDKALLNPSPTDCFCPFPFVNSSLILSKIKTFASTDIPIVKTIPAIPGRVKTAPIPAKIPKIKTIFRTSATSA